jgi:hypothetical protein
VLSYCFYLGRLFLRIEEWWIAKLNVLEVGEQQASLGEAQGHFQLVLDAARFCIKITCINSYSKNETELWAMFLCLEGEEGIEFVWIETR